MLISIIGGWLLMPQTGWDLPGIPEYTKHTAIALGLIIGGIISGHHRRSHFTWKIYDLPIIIYCLCPIATSMTNQLGFYNGMSSTYTEIISWGIPYLAGRFYFGNTETLNDLFLGIIAGGLMYVPLCLYEIRMSPQLSNMFYGFFPHSFLQHFRYGGYRPIVFLQHGLAVSLWMAVTTTLAFWSWRSRQITYISGIPISLLTILLIVTCILCKSANGWLFMTIGCAAFYLYKTNKSKRVFAILILVIPIYIVCRLSGLIQANDLENIAATIFDNQRAASLGVRLYQEELFGLKALERPLFGWGGYGRGWPVDPITGERLVDMIDSLWLITFSTRGFAGLVTFLSSMLIGSWLIFRRGWKRINVSEFTEMKVVLLALVVVFFMIDSLVNSMPNPVFILISGALVSFHVAKLKN